MSAKFRSELPPDRPMTHLTVLVFTLLSKNNIKSSGLGISFLEPQIGRGNNDKAVVVLNWRRSQPLHFLTQRGRQVRANFSPFI